MVLMLTIISEAPKMQKEIEALEDFSGNIGYFIGPIVAGFLADRVGNGVTFTILGISGVLVGFLLMNITPKKITIPFG